MRRCTIGLLAALLLFPAVAARAAETPAAGVTVHFFWAPNCQHCLEAEPFLDELRFRHPLVEVRKYEIWQNRENFEQLRQVAEALGQPLVSTPAIVVGERIWFGFSPAVAAEVGQAVRRCLAAGCPDPVSSGAAPPAGPGPPPAKAPVTVPLLGELDPAALSLPLLTVTLGLADSFNPCAFFVLFFLLGLLVHARSRRTMLLVGGTFVLCSGVVYFLFMAAWLNLFLLAGRQRSITLAAGGVALLVAALNIKDFFFFRRGPSLAISEQARPRLFARMRGLLQATRTSSVLLGTVVLALAANSYELLCTAGFPMVYTRVLTLRALPLWQYYLFLGLYNLVYVLPLLAIVLLFTVTLGARKLSEWHGRVLKLVSGAMMLAFGLTLLLRPALLESAAAALALLALALAAAGGTVLLCRRRLAPGR